MSQSAFGSQLRFPAQVEEGRCGDPAGPLGAARGIVVGLALVTPFWLCVAAGIWWRVP